MYLELEIARDPITKNVQRDLTNASLRAVTAAVEIWYDPDPTGTIIKEDEIFVESFFAIPDEQIESTLHLQSPWLFRLELDRAKMVDRKLTMPYVAGRISETFGKDLFVIWSEDNSEKLIIRCRVQGSPDKDDEGPSALEDVTCNLHSPLSFQSGPPCLCIFGGGTFFLMFTIALSCNF